jgi:hypothetical protein
VSTLWRKACGDHPGAKVHEHGPIRNVSDWSNYIFKDDNKYHDPENPAECVRLLAKGTPNLTWGSRLISEKQRDAIWSENVEKWYPDSESAEVVEMKRGTGVPQQTTKVVINARESIERNRPSEPVETRSGTSVPRNNPTTNVRILVGKNSGFNRATGQFRAAFMRLSHRNHGSGSRSRDHRQSRPVSHRGHRKVRSIGPMPKASPDRILGRLVRAP